MGQNISCKQLILLITSALWILNGCKSDREISKPNPAFAKFIEAYTAGTISKNAPIRIQLAASVQTAHAAGEEVKKDVFSFSPGVSGKAVWIDAATIEFQPSQSLKPDRLYRVNFNLGKVAKVPDDFQTFTFQFQTIAPAFELVAPALESRGKGDQMTLRGEIRTADTEKAEEVEQILQAFLEGKKLPVNWSHSEHSNTHSFTIDKIDRRQAETKLELVGDGKPIRAAVKTTKTFEVPALGVFKVLDVIPMTTDAQYAAVYFSDPLSALQDLTGLISVENVENIAFAIEGSVVKIYTGDDLDGNYVVHMNEGIENVRGQKLKTGYTANIVFENRLPGVKMIGRGNILPGDDKLTLPFEAVNLSAVDVSIIQIYENNVLRFFQDNGYSGDYNLRRVGSPIVQKTIRLDDDKSLNLKIKQRFALDIDQILKTAPGALYRVTIGFRPEYSLYGCSAEPGSEAGSDSWQDKIDEDDDFWSFYDNYYPFGYNWEERNNPCAASYYNKEKWASGNIIASNLGLTVKKGSNRDITVFANNILTTEPVEGVDLTFLDYQNQVVEKGKTDGDGKLTIGLKRTPFLLVARKKGEVNYVKLDDAGSLPLSRFDVSGEEVQKGIKAFIFGERGVWRPGDSLYLNCILDTREANLPADHPIEFELFTPRGNLYQKAIQNKAEGGYQVFKTRTEKDAPTGNWLLKVKVGGAHFEKRVRIETVMPNRLKIDLNFSGDTVLGTGQNNTGNLQVDWLFGAPAKYLEVKMDATFSVNKQPFEKWKQYSFTNPVSDFSSSSQTVFEGKTNETGSAPVRLKTDGLAGAPGMLTASMLIKAFEPGGAFSVRTVRLPYSSYLYYLGLRLPEGDKTWGFLETGKTHAADIIRVDAKGALGGNDVVEVSLYRIQWRWWWDESALEAENFSHDRYKKLIKTENVQLQNGKGKYQFTIGKQDWGRYLLLVKDPNGGHATGQVVYVDEPGWQYRDNTDDPTAASMLSFTANKETFTPGEEVVLTIPSHEGGRALVSIESGSKVLKTFLVKTNAGQTTVKFKAEPSMAPNAYAYVALLQPHAQTANDLPIRMYGVIPLQVNDKNTVLRPVIEMPATLRPGQKSSVGIREQQGREMYYSLAIVDEGLLDLTNFKTPDAHGHFYAREALGVKTWDIYDFVIGARANKMDRILTIGGDEEAGRPTQPKEANRFKPVVKYLGPFRLKKGAKNVHEFTLPEYIGSVKVMVVAAHEGSYGSADKRVAVKKPLMLLGTAPRVMSPQETVTIPVSVFAMEKNLKQVTVRLKSNKLIAVEGAASKVVDIQSPGEHMVYFRARSLAEGVAHLNITAAAGKETAETNIELSVKNPNDRRTDIYSKNLEAKAVWQQTISPIGAPAQAEAVVELSSIPALNLEKRLDFLINYPHGCVEQIVSGAFPQLYLQDLTNLTDERKAFVQRNVRAVIGALQNYRLSQGGFSYWPGGREADDWGTTYAGHFLLEAKKAGFSVSETMLQSWISYQTMRARSWSPAAYEFFGGDMAQAYRLYALALAKAADMGAMNRLREFKYLTPQAKWRLAAAYALVGQKQTALQLISGLPTTFDRNYHGGYTYGSSLRDEAMVLQTLTLLERRQEAAKQASSIAGKLSREDRYSTQTTAWSLLAISQYTGKNPGNRQDASVTINGKTTPVRSNETVTQIKIPKNANATISIKNNGNAVLYARILNTGKPEPGQETPPATHPALLTMTVDYLTLNLQPVEETDLKQGTDFVARVTVKNTGNGGTYENMALSQIFPAGWEIINTRLNDGAGAFKQSAFDFQDIRDDRVYTYFSLRANESKTFYIMLNAAYLGDFYQPATVCYEMYDQNMATGVPSSNVTVRE